MKKRIEKLTDAHAAQIDVWADRWIEIGLRVGDAARPRFEAAVADCYRFANLAPPQRVERVQDCSREDAIAEGAADWEGECTLRDKRLTAVQIQYAMLWESIHGPGSWDLNPWVWCLSYRTVQP